MAKVLLVEDDNSLREIFEMRLQADGYQTVTAGDGEEGLTVALKEKPDLIVADVMMPKLSGFEMLENLRAAPEMKDTKVIMMTALGQAEDQARGENLGVVKYLVKSQATLEDFAKVVADVLPPNSAGGSPKTDSSTKDASQNNQQESENNMQEDTTPTNPATPPADDSAGAPATNPVAGDQPAPGGMDNGQMSTAQEQAGVQDQINSFAGSTPAPDAGAMPAADAGAPAPAPSEPAAAPDASAPAVDPAVPAAPASDDQPAAPADPNSGSL